MRTRIPSVGAGPSRWRTGLVLPVAVGLFALALPAFSGPDLEPSEQPDISALVGDTLERRQEDRGSQRPAYLPEPAGHLSTASAPTPMTNPVLVSKTARWGQLNLPYLLADTALPFRYHVDRGLAERFGLETVVEAMGQWDDIPGSRWATKFDSVVAHPGGGPRRDGHPVVYLRHDCPEGYLGTARWNTDPERMHVDHRYGTGALYGTQVDIAVCAQLETAEQLQGLLAHEVGHVMGMAHLCEPGEVCWREEHEASEGHRCRAMYAMWGPCRGGLTALDGEAARHLYPTLQRLHGPTRVDTAARASYATTWTHTASTVVLTRADRGVPEALLGAALAAPLGGPLLLGEPDASACVANPAAAELARAAQHGATVVLAGDWPASCEPVLESWNLTVRRLGSPDSRAPALSVAAADLLLEHVDERPSSAFLVTFGEDDGAQAALDAAPAAAEAGRRAVPLLFTERAALSSSVGSWLSAHPQIEDLWIVGEASPALLRELGQRGLTTVRIPGDEPVTRAIFLASSRAPAPALRPEPVVIAPSESITDAVIGAAAAARLGARLLLTPPHPDADVLSWLDRYAPRGGYVVGSLAGLPYGLQRVYTAAVGPPLDPVPSRQDAVRGPLEAPRLP